MEYQAIIEAIDVEIAKLEKARGMLIKSGKAVAVISRQTAKSLATKKAPKRALSVDARARIAAAQRKRWAAVKRASK
jgi:hypothetical protein